jgi:hypothetical protein
VLHRRRRLRFSREDIDSLLDALEANDLGSAGSIAPAIIGAGAHH